MSDFEKIIEVTRMAKHYGDYIRKTRVKDTIGGFFFVVGGLIQMAEQFKRIAFLFPNAKKRRLVTDWYHTVYEMRSIDV